MKILVVADLFPWPPLNGGLMRMATCIDALSDVGSIDLFSLVDQRQANGDVPTRVMLDRSGTTPYPQIDRSNRWRPAWLARRQVPVEVAMRSADRSPLQQFEAWVKPRYDLVWFRSPAAYEWLGRPHLGPTVVDFDGLNAEREQQRAAVLRGSDRRRFDGATLRASLAILQARLNAQCWKTFLASVASDVARVVLTSDAEVERSGIANAVPVVNTYARPARALGRSVVGEPPVIMFQGTFDYGPNADGARWFVDIVTPLIRKELPTTRVRLVGKPIPAFDQLHHPPGVVVAGVVASMETELARADLAVAPIRYGSGTRLKILESFAHRVPVVSTTVGAEGLDVEDGVHLLVADDPRRFADACLQLLSDTATRQRLVEAAEQLFLERYESSVAREQIRGIVGSLVPSPPTAR